MAPFLVHLTNSVEQLSPSAVLQEEIDCGSLHAVTKETDNVGVAENLPTQIPSNTHNIYNNSTVCLDLMEEKTECFCNLTLTVFTPLTTQPNY